MCNALGSGSGCTTQPKNGVDINTVITVVINLLSVFVGVLSVIMIMVSGFKYVTSGGDSSKVSSAKNTLIYAIVGLVIVFLAQTIVKFVLAKVTGTTGKKGMIVTTHRYALDKKYYTLNYRA